MRPKLRPGTYFVPTPDGVCFFAAGRAETLTGRSIHAWVERLAPHLDGRTSLSDLVAPLEETKRAMVEDIVAALADRDLVVDAAAELPHTLSPAELDRYAGEVAFLDAVSDSGPHRFQRWRTCRALAIGSGLTFTGLVTMLAESGLAHLVTVVTPEAGPVPPSPPVPPPLDEPALAALCAGVDLVLHVSDHLMAARAHTLDRLCRRLGLPLVQGLVAGDEAWLGPVSGVTPEGEGWEAGWRRLAGHSLAGALRADGAFADHAGDAPGRFVAGAAASLAGAMIGVIAFRHVTGVATQAGRMTRLDLATLATSEHGFAPYPGTFPPTPVPAQDVTLDTAGDPAREDGLVRALIDDRSPSLVDPWLGLIAEVGERDFAQLPLNIAGAVVRPPGEAPALVTGAGLDFRGARLDAVRRGLELYSWRTAHARVARGERSPFGTWLGDGGLAGTPGARLVLPPPRPVPLGVASGHSRDSAVHAGLVALCQRLTTDAAATATAPFPRVDLVPGLLDGDGAIYLKLLETAGADVTVFDVTGTLGLPTYAFCRGERTVAYAGGADRASGLAHGLQAVLLDFQARLNSQPEYSPPLPRTLPQPLRGQVAAELAGDDRPLTSAQLVQRLTALGRLLAWLSLDDDPAVSEVLPHVVYVTALGG